MPYHVFYHHVKEVSMLATKIRLVLPHIM